MKKSFCINKLQSPEMNHFIKSANALILAYRKGDEVFLSNIDIGEGGSISWDDKKAELIFTFRLNNGDFLALGDQAGTAKKEKLS